MKQLVRAVTLVLLIGGWALASAAVQVIRTPSNVVIIPKDRLGYQDTYIDTREWTMADNRSHASLVTRLIAMGRSDVLWHTVKTPGASPHAQLVDAFAHPSTGTPK